MTSEIAIVGASASGLFAATLLARAGRQVTVYERADRLEPEARTLITTSVVSDQLGDLATGAIVNEIDRYELFANGQVGEVHLGRPDYIVERATLIHALVEAAVDAGATLALGHRFLGCTARDDMLELQLLGGNGSQQVETQTLIGGDGAFSAVARACGWAQLPTVPLLQAIVALPEHMSSSSARVWFRPQDTPYFYWLIPDSEQTGALGVIGERGPGLRARLDAFLADKGLTAVGYQGAQIPRYSGWVPIHRRLGNGHVYLVGDAAGHVKVSTVGGLVTGFRGALGVVERILGGPSRQTLRALRRELDGHFLVRKVIHRFGESDYCRLLDLLNGPTRRSLHHYTRDEVTPMLWRLAINQPRFVPLAARSLLARGG